MPFEGPVQRQVEDIERFGSGHGHRHDAKTRKAAREATHYLEAREQIEGAQVTVADRLAAEDQKGATTADLEALKARLEADEETVLMDTGPTPEVNEQERARLIELLEDTETIAEDARRRMSSEIDKERILNLYRESTPEAVEHLEHAYALGLAGERQALTTAIENARGVIGPRALRTLFNLGHNSLEALATSPKRRLQEAFALGAAGKDVDGESPSERFRLLRERVAAYDPGAVEELEAQFEAGRRLYARRMGTLGAEVRYRDARQNTDGTWEFDQDGGLHVQAQVTNETMMAAEQAEARDALFDELEGAVKTEEETTEDASAEASLEDAPEDTETHDIEAGGDPEETPPEEISDEEEESKGSPEASNEEGNEAGDDDPEALAPAPRAPFEAEASLEAIRAIKDTGERRAALRQWKRNWMLQQTRLAEAQGQLYEMVKENPTVTLEELETRLHSLTEKYGFTEGQEDIGKRIIASLHERHREIRGLRDRYETDEALYTALFEEPPLEKVEVVESPLTLYFKCTNVRDYNRARSLSMEAIAANTDDESREAFNARTVNVFAADALRAGLEDAILIGMKSAPEASHIHAEERSLKRFLDTELQEERDEIAEWAQFALGLRDAEDAEAREHIIRNFLRVRRMHIADERAKGEIFAYIKDGIGEGLALKELTEPHAQGGQKDFLWLERDDNKLVNLITSNSQLSSFFQTPEEQELLTDLITQVYDVEYKAQLNKSFAVVNDIIAAGYTADEAIAFLQKQPLASWEKAKKRLIEDEPVFARVVRGFKHKFNIEIEDIERDIPEFNELSEGQQLLVLENLTQISHGRVYEEAYKGYREHLPEAKLLSYKWLGMRWQQWTKSYQLAVREQTTARDIREGGMDLHKGVLEQLVATTQGGPEVEIEPDGKTLRVGYIGPRMFAGPDGTVDEQYASRLHEFNTVCIAYSKIPAESCYPTAPKSEQNECKIARENYENMRGNLITLLVEYNSKHAPGRSAHDIMMQVKEVDQAVHMNQFLNTHPEAEDELKRIEDQKVWRRTLTTLASERGAYVAIGTLTRTTMVTTLATLGVMLLPAVTGALGAISGHARGKRELREHAQMARQGGDTGDMHEQLARLTYTESKNDSGEAKEKKLNAAKNKIDLFVEVKGQINELDTLIGRAQALIALEKSAIAGDTDTEEIQKMVKEKNRVLTSLQLRAYYLEEKLYTKGHFNPGTLEEGKITNYYTLSAKIAEAKALGGIQTSEVKERARRLTRYLAWKEARVANVHDTYVWDKIESGMTLGIQFAALGSLIREGVDILRGGVPQAAAAERPADAPKTQGESITVAAPTAEETGTEEKSKGPTAKGNVAKAPPASQEHAPQQAVAGASETREQREYITVASPHEETLAQIAPSISPDDAQKAGLDISDGIDDRERLLLTFWQANQRMLPTVSVAHTLFENISTDESIAREQIAFIDTRHYANSWGRERAARVFGVDQFFGGDAIDNIDFKTHTERYSFIDGTYAYWHGLPSEKAAQLIKVLHDPTDHNETAALVAGYDTAKYQKFSVSLHEKSGQLHIRFRGEGPRVEIRITIEGKIAVNGPGLTNWPGGAGYMNNAKELTAASLQEAIAFVNTLEEDAAKAVASGEAAAREASQQQESVHRGTEDSEVPTQRTVHGTRGQEITYTKYQNRLLDMQLEGKRPIGLAFKYGVNGELEGVNVDEAGLKTGRYRRVFRSNLAGRLGLKPNLPEHKAILDELITFGRKLDAIKQVADALPAGQEKDRLYSYIYTQVTGHPAFHNNGAYTYEGRSKNKYSSEDIFNNHFYGGTGNVSFKWTTKLKEPELPPGAVRRRWGPFTITSYKSSRTKYH